MNQELLMATKCAFILIIISVGSFKKVRTQNMSSTQSIISKGRLTMSSPSCGDSCALNSVTSSVSTTSVEDLNILVNSTINTNSILTKVSSTTLSSVLSTYPASTDMLSTKSVFTAGSKTQGLTSNSSNSLTDRTTMIKSPAFEIASNSQTVFEASISLTNSILQSNTLSSVSLLETNFTLLSSMPTSSLIPSSSLLLSETKSTASQLTIQTGLLGTQDPKYTSASKSGSTIQPSVKDSFATGSTSMQSAKDTSISGSGNTIQSFVESSFTTVSNLLNSKSANQTIKLQTDATISKPFLSSRITTNGIKPQSISANSSIHIMPTSKGNHTIPGPKKADDNDEFRTMIIGVSVGAGALFITVFLVCVLVVVARRRKKAPHRQLHYRMNYSTPEKGQDELLGSKDSIEMYSNMKYAHRDAFVNRGLDSSEGSVTTLPGTSRSTEPLTAQDSSFKRNGASHPTNGRYNEVFYSEDGPGASNLDNLPSESHHDVSLRLLQPWSESLDNRNSYQYKKLREQVEDGIRDLYRSDREFRKAKVKKFRPGSVMADLSITFSNSIVEPLSRLHKAVSSGHIGMLDVDKDHPLRAPDRIRSTGSNAFDVIPLASGRTSLQAKACSQPILLQNGDHPPHATNYVIPISSGNLERGRSDELFIGGQDGARALGKPAAYENFNPLQRFGENSVCSSFGPSPNQNEANLAPGSLGNPDLAVSSDSGYLGSPTSSTDFFDGDQEGSESAAVIARKSRKQSDGPAPVPVQPPKAPITGGVDTVQEDEPTVHVALFDFHPVDSRELSLRQGEMVTVLSRDESGWFKVMNDTGKQGWVPETFLVIVSSSQVVTTKETVETLEYFDSVMEELDETNEDITPAVSPDVEYKPPLGEEEVSSAPEAITIPATYENIDHVEPEVIGEEYFALYDFVPEGPEELEFREGDRVIVVRKTESGWCRGMANGKEGWFPFSYLKEADQSGTKSEATTPSNSDHLYDAVDLPSNRSPAERRSLGEDSLNAFQPPERYKGLFVEILKRQSAPDLGEKFRMEDFAPGEKSSRLQKSQRSSLDEESLVGSESGPSKPERVVPVAPEEVDETDSPTVGVKLRKKAKQKEAHDKQKRLSKGPPPQKPVPPPPTKRRLTKTSIEVTKTVKEVVVVSESGSSSAGFQREQRLVSEPSKVEVVLRYSKSGNSDKRESPEQHDQNGVERAHVNVKPSIAKPSSKVQSQGQVPHIDVSVRSDLSKHAHTDSPSSKPSTNKQSNELPLLTQWIDNDGGVPEERTGLHEKSQRPPSKGSPTKVNGNAEFNVSVVKFNPPTKPVPQIRRDSKSTESESKEQKSDSMKKPSVPQKPLPTASHSGAVPSLRARSQSENNDQKDLFVISVAKSRNSLGEETEERVLTSRSSSITNSRQDSKKKPPVPVKRGSMSDAKVSIPSRGQQTANGTETVEVLQNRSSSDSVVKPKPAPRTDRGISSGQRDSYNESQALERKGREMKPSRPPQPSFQVKLEGERIALRNIGQNVKSDRARIRTVIESYQAQEKGELNLAAGDILYELEVYREHGVGYGLLEDGKQGFYPLNRVKVNGSTA